MTNLTYVCRRSHGCVYNISVTEAAMLERWCSFYEALVVAEGHDISEICEMLFDWLATEADEKTAQHFGMDRRDVVEILTQL